MYWITNVLYRVSLSSYAADTIYLEVLNSNCRRYTNLTPRINNEDFRNHAISTISYLVGAFDTDKCLSEGHRPEATVKEEQANVGIDM